MSLLEVIDAVNNLSAEENEFCTRKDYVQSKYFCAEETIDSSKVCVTVEGVGKLNLPLDNETLKQLSNVSSKDPFFRSVYDRHVRDVQWISESQLKVEFDVLVFTEVLKKLASQLKIDEHCKLIPHLHHMFLYDSLRYVRLLENIDTMIATLVLVLPSYSTVGTFHVNHLRTFKSFNHPTNLSSIKCIAFYSGCTHWATNVGRRVCAALTYNIELKRTNPPFPIDITITDDHLHRAIARYFDTDKQPVQLILRLTHAYTHKSLSWYKLKGYDRIIAWAMFAVAKKQKLTPYLALAESKETWVYSKTDEPKMTDKYIEFYYWRDENNMKYGVFGHPKQFHRSAFNEENCNTHFVGYEPYRVINLSPEKSEETRENFFRISYIVLIKGGQDCVWDFKLITV